MEACDKIASVLLNLLHCMHSVSCASAAAQVLNIAYIAVAAQCTLIAAAGYAMYGAGALDVVTFNLPRGLLATLCASLILVNPVAKFALTVDTPAMAATAAIARLTPGAHPLF